jgi:hypothetical protein
MYIYIYIYIYRCIYIYIHIVAEIRLYTSKPFNKQNQKDLESIALMSSNQVCTCLYIHICTYVGVMIRVSGTSVYADYDILQTR